MSRAAHVLCVVAAGACILVAAADVGAQTIQFTPSTLASLSSAPGAIASADFDGDGRADLAVTSPDSSLLSVFLQQPGGSMSSPTSYDVCARPSAVNAADVNDDGAIDLLVASRGCSVVSVLINTGSGSFVAAASRSTGARPAALATGDFNRDGHQDFATANIAANTITIRLGTGTGAFSNPQNIRNWFSSSGARRRGFQSRWKAGPSDGERRKSHGFGSPRSRQR